MTEEDQLATVTCSSPAGRPRAPRGPGSRRTSGTQRCTARAGSGRSRSSTPSPFPSQIAGECSDFDPTDFMSKKAARRMDRFAQLGIAAGLEAAESAGIADLIRERRNALAS